MTEISSLLFLPATDSFSLVQLDRLLLVCQCQSRLDIIRVASSPSEGPLRTATPLPSG